MRYLGRLALVLCVGFLIFPTADAHATHFRYGTISWFVADDAAPARVTVVMETAWRRDAFTPLPAVGQTIQLNNFKNATFIITSLTQNTTVFSTTNIPGLVTTANAADNWFTAISTFVVDLTGRGTTFRVDYEDCCRFSTLADNNGDTPFILDANIVLGAQINRSPVPSLLPVVTLRRGAPNTFAISATDPDGDQLSYSFTPPGTIVGRSGLTTDRPAGLVLSSDGVVSWTPSAAGLFTMQVLVADTHGAKVPVDFIMNVVNGPATGVAPAISVNSKAQPPSFTVLAGTPLSFTVVGTDDDSDSATGLANTFVTLSSGSLPPGATMSPSLPFNARAPLSSTFSWQPTADQAGTYTFSFAATDGTGLQSLTSASVTVLANLPPSIGCPVVEPFPATSAAGASVTFNVLLTDADKDLVQLFLKVDGGALAKGPAVIAGAATAVSINADIPLGNHVVTVVADDGRPFGDAQCQANVSVVSVGQQIDFAAAGPLTYGDGPLTLTAVASSGLPVTLTVLSGPGELSGFDLRNTGAGSIVVRATQEGDSWRNAAIPVDQTIEVKPAALTVKANDAQRLYGANTPVLNASITGFVAKENESVLGGALAFATGDTPASHVGAYTITPSGLTASNYSISFVDGTLQVMPATLTVTANNASRVYGSVNPSFAASYSGFVPGETPAVLGGSLSFVTAALPSSSAGTYPVTPAGLTSTDYAISFAPGILTITPAPLTVTASDEVKIVGAPNPWFHATFAGFVLGQDRSALSGKLALTTTATAGSAVGSYPIAPSGLTSSNYAITFVNGTLSVRYFVCLDYDPLDAEESGSVVRIKFRLCDAVGHNLSSPSVTPQATRIRNVQGAETSLDDTLRLFGGLYAYNLKTTGLPPGVYQFFFTVDGVEYWVPFALRPPHADFSGNSGRRGDNDHDDNRGGDERSRDDRGRK